LPPAFSPDGKRLLYVDGNQVRALELFPAKHTANEWGELARLLTGARLDRSDTAVPLNAEESRRLWQAFHVKPASPFSLPKGATAAMHLRQSFVHEQAGDWFAAAWHLERLLEAGAGSPRDHYRLGAALAALGRWPAARAALARAVASGVLDWRAHFLAGWAHANESQWKEAVGQYTTAIHFDKAVRHYVWRRRGEAFAHLQRWQEAAADYERLYGSGQAGGDDWVACALLRLHAGDAKGYQQVCEAWQRRLGKFAAISDKIHFAWTVSVAPFPGLDRKLALAFAQEAVKTSPKDASARTVLGTALYRDGQYAVAVENLDQAVKLRNGLGGIHDSLFLALAHHQLGHTEEANRWHARATVLLQSPPGYWMDVIRLALLRAEVEKAVKGKPADGK
jgi:tetratricopeptide (TPR) repeat protein